jgi:hypothetical protein
MRHGAGYRDAVIAPGLHIAGGVKTADDSRPACAVTARARRAAASSPSRRSTTGALIASFSFRIVILNKRRLINMPSSHSLDKASALFLALISQGRYLSVESPSGVHLY